MDKIVINLPKPLPASNDCLPHAAMNLGSARGVGIQPRPGMVSLVDAKPIAATMTRTVSAAGMDWGLLAAAGVLTLIPGAVVIWFVRNYIAKGFALGRV